MQWPPRPWPNSSPDVTSVHTGHYLLLQYFQKSKQQIYCLSLKTFLTAVSIDAVFCTYTCEGYLEENVQAVP